MKLSLNNNQYILTEKGMDISIPLSDDPKSVLAWYCEPITIEPVITENFIGEVKQGGSVNFRNVKLNLHGNGTHTECVGHISKEDYTINQCLKEFHFVAQLISVRPKISLNLEYHSEDLIIDKKLIEDALKNIDSKEFPKSKAIVIRTLENGENKKHINYSNTNPTYFTKDAIEFLNEIGIEHLLVDLPSVDREEDGGSLIAHHTFWNYPEKPLTHKTITELVYIPNEIKDGTYLLNISITSLETDASPSKIILYQIYLD